jgi:3-methyl-2-oxobutanoate hydroxymethyltransferase
MKWTVDSIRRRKGKGKIVSLTAYDYASAQCVDAAGIHLVIVGDSLGMTVLGYDSTIPVTMADMVHHTRAVMRGVESALVVADMPFLSYQVSLGEAVENAGRLIKEAGADAVKIEGGAFRAETVSHLVANGIPVMGHIGLTPQSVRAWGGYKVQGRGAEQAATLQADALALEKAGVFSLVLEGMPAELAGAITAAVSIPTVGIGAGPDCDGQVLVMHDMLGLYSDRVPKFVKRYAELGKAMAEAFASYKAEVESGVFPGPENCY